jgi:hypothetical protein
MAAMTADQIVNRIRSICSGPVFGFQEAVSWVDFDLQPESNIDGVYRIPPMSSQGSLGGFGFYEDRQESVQIWVARKHNGDYAAVRSALSNDVHSLTAAVMRDGHETSGDYAVTDEGRGHAIAEVPDTTYMTMRLTLPINYDAQW